MFASLKNRMGSDKKKQDFTVYGFGQLVNLLSPLAVAPFIVLICNEDGFGKVGLGFALALFLILIVDYAFEIKGIKAVAQNRDNARKLAQILNLTLFSKVLLFGIATILAGLLIFLIPFFTQEKPLFLYSLTIVFAQVFNPTWFLQGVEKFALASAINICTKVVYVILVFVFITEADDYIYVNLFLGSSALFFNLFGLILIMTRRQIALNLPATHTIIDTLKTDFSFCVSQLFLSARQLSPLVLTGFFLGFHMAGLYKILEQVITLFRTFIQVFLRFFYPSLCYKIQSSTDDGLHFWKKYTTLNLALVISGIGLIFVGARPILNYFQVDIESLDEMVPLFRFSLAIPILMALSLPLEQMMFALNHRSYTKVAVSVTLINVTALIFLIQSYQIAGILVALIVAELLFIALYSYNAYPEVKSKIRHEAVNS